MGIGMRKEVECEKSMLIPVMSIAREMVTFSSVVMIVGNTVVGRNNRDRDEQ